MHYVSHPNRRVVLAVTRRSARQAPIFVSAAIYLGLAKLLPALPPRSSPLAAKTLLLGESILSCRCCHQLTTSRNSFSILDAVTLVTPRLYLNASPSFTPLVPTLVLVDCGQSSSPLTLSQSPPRSAVPPSLESGTVPKLTAAYPRWRRRLLTTF